MGWPGLILTVLFTLLQSQMGKLDGFGFLHVVIRGTAKLQEPGQ
jgi:hypothetical protein